MAYRKTDLSDDARRIILDNLKTQMQMHREADAVLARAMARAHEDGLTDREVAEALGVSRETIGRWRRSARGTGQGDQGDS